ncbi:MAG: preprotein translocase subunit SecA [Pirellulaceae bacterium]|nr:preprotein translocase subunit SecA [Pirellulaceae bacterium]
MTQAFSESPAAESIIQRFSVSAASHLGYRPRAVQIDAASRLMGRVIVEMATGEGKTLSLALAASLIASTGRRVCVATANDYLAHRDAHWMRPLYTDLGLTVGNVATDHSTPQRSQSYQRDVAYGTIREFAFDHLRAAMAARRQQPIDASPTLDVLIVDEADSVLIDEARTPLVISSPEKGLDPADEATLRWAANVAGTFHDSHDFVRCDPGGMIALTTSGRQRVLHLQMPPAMGPLSMTDIIHRLEIAIWINQTMYAGQQYIIRDGKVSIIHEYTGRASQQRMFGAGVHQAIEAREGLKITPPNQPIARITVQDFTDLFAHVSGVTATAREDQNELVQVYQLPVEVIPSHRPCQRKIHAACVCRDEPTKWQRIAEETMEMIQAGRAVLIGTRSVQQSEALSQVLRQCGVEHVVLNARHFDREAEIVAQAGNPARVTVATNMAGRGTDIELSDAVRQAGGLHVIVSEAHAASRIDRQLFGRCARQGDPGTARLFVCPDDEVLLLGLGPARYGRTRQSYLATSDSRGLLSQLVRAQRLVSRQQRLGRSALTAHQSQLNSVLQNLGLDPQLDPLPE